MLWQIFEDKCYNFTNFFLRYIRGLAIHCCKSYTKSFLSTLFVVFCFEITFKIVKMRSISAVDFFSYEFVNGAISDYVYAIIDWSRVTRVFNNSELKGAPYLAKKCTKRSTNFSPPKVPYFWLKAHNFLTLQSIFIAFLCINIFGDIKFCIFVLYFVGFIVCFP